MKYNVGGADKTIPFLVGIAALVIGIFAPIIFVWKVLAFIVAGIALVLASSQRTPKPES